MTNSNGARANGSQPKLATAATSVRYWIVGLCVLMSILLYLDRFAIAPIATTIIQELGLSEEQYGRAVGAFFLAYALCQVPSGWLSDRFGARSTLALYVLGWSLATIGLGFAGGLLTISAMRMVLGVAQAGAYPTAVSLLKRWVPATSRGRANTIVSMGGRAGNLLAQFLTPLLAVSATAWLGWQSGGWRAVLVVYGALGLVWVVAFYWLYRDSPSEHPWCNLAERDLISQGTIASTPASVVPSVALGDFVLAILRSPEVWLISTMAIAVNVGWVFLVTWLPRFLMSRHGAELAALSDNPQTLAGMITAFVGAGGILGSLCGGAAADWFVAAYGLRWGRRLPGLSAGYLVMAMYLVATQRTSLWLLVGLMFAISFAIDFGLGASWASYQDIGGRNVATVLGIGNMCGNLGASWFGWYIGALAQASRWNAVFLIAGVAMALYATGWLLFDATRPVVRADAH